MLRRSRAVIFVMASGVVRIDAGVRVAVTVTVGKEAAVSRVVTVCADTRDAASAVAMTHPMGRILIERDRGESRVFVCVLALRYGATARAVE
jgi:hypothetical protein